LEIEAKKLYWNLKHNPKNDDRIFATAAAGRGIFFFLVLSPTSATTNTTRARA
jgi:hypothetical protein